jgi:gamma-glutamyltranspeptidase
MYPTDTRPGRPVTLAPNGMVAAPHALASAAGVDVLRAGGTAVDAAIATSAVLAVVYPHMTGIGGDAFWLIRDAKTGSVACLDGGGRTVAGATVEALTAAGGETIPVRGIAPATLTVPGALASWGEAHATHGRLPFARILEAAIGYARDGFPVTQRLADVAELWRDGLSAHPATAAIFLPDGAPPRAGTTLRNPDLARTLEIFADAGPAGFYEGEVADAFVRFSDANGGHFTEADLAARNARWAEPISTVYRGTTIYNTPPPTQGFVALEMLNLVEGFDISALDFLGPEHIHLLVQAKQVAFHDRDRYLADPAFADVPVERLLSGAYTAERRTLIGTKTALPWDGIPPASELDGDTCFMAVVDGEGNAAALIQSVYMAFGSMMVADGTGVLLQNRAAYFSLDPAHPNRIAPGKTPMHTLIASMAERDGRLWAVLGTQGADGQPQVHAHLYSAMLDFGLDIQQAIEAPRFLSGRISIDEPRDMLHLEGRMPEAAFAGLEARGHKLDRWPDWYNRAGQAQGVVIDPDSGVRIGGSDPRSDGAAVGY